MKDTDGSIGNENEQDDRRLNERREQRAFIPSLIKLDKSENKRDYGRPKQDKYEPVLELLKDQLPKRCWRVFREFCRTKHVTSSKVYTQARILLTVLSIELSVLCGKVRSEAAVWVHVEVLENLLGRLGPGIVHQHDWGIGR